MCPCCLVKLSLLSLAINGYTCPDVQQDDTNLICNIFQSTDIENKIPNDFAHNNYCNWGYFEYRIGCKHANDTFIDFIELEYYDGNGINGTLDFRYPWPKNLRELDLEQSTWSSSRLYGEWNWRSLIGLNYLTQLDLEDNQFSGIITNDDWMVIASLPVLTDFTLKNNNFETNFSQIFINTISSIENMEIQNNNLKGIMNVNTNGFFNAFPNLKLFWIQGNDVYGNFNNIDAISSKYLSVLKEFKLSNNEYSGTLSLSNDLTLSSKLTHFQIDNNNFDGPVQWEIFSNLNTLKYFSLADNSFSGSVNLISLPSSLLYFEINGNDFDGSIHLDAFTHLNNLKKIDIGDNLFSGSFEISNDSLSLPVSLTHIKLDYNSFTGSVDWSIFNKLYNLIELDMNNNAFSGTIDWSVISDLHNNGSLQSLYLHNNAFTGYANFEWIRNETKFTELNIDIDIPCDPIMYPCIGGTQINRSKQTCYSKVECIGTCVCIPTPQPTSNPSLSQPTNDPSRSPTNDPSRSPTNNPSRSPTKSNNNNNNQQQTNTPSNNVTPSPTYNPTVIDLEQEVLIETKLTTQTSSVSLGVTDNEELFNFDAVTDTEIIMGICIIFGCCIFPLLIGIAICCWIWKQKNRVNSVVIVAIDKKPETHNTNDSYSNNNIDSMIVNVDDSKSVIELSNVLNSNSIKPPGLAGADSLKIDPDSLKITPLGLIDDDSLNIEGHEKETKPSDIVKFGADIIDNNNNNNNNKLNLELIGSELSDGMYENGGETTK